MVPRISHPVRRGQSATVWRTVDRSRAHVVLSCAILDNRKVNIPRTTKTITFSLPQEMADRLDEVMKQLGRSGRSNGNKSS